MDTATLVAFAIVAFIGIATPGPTVLLALVNGSRFGVGRACYGMAGAVASDFILIGAVSLGLGALLAASEFWFSVLKWLGVGYLTVLGVALLRSRRRLEADFYVLPVDAAGSPLALFRKSLLVAITNPKGYLFFSAFLPQFVAPGASQAPQYIQLALVFAVIDLAVMSAYATLGSHAMRVLREAGTVWLDRICGGALLALAGSLAVYRRA